MIVALAYVLKMTGSTPWLLKRRTKRRSEKEPFNHSDTSQVLTLSFLLSPKPKTRGHIWAKILSLPGSKFCFCASVSILSEYVLHVNLAHVVFVLPLSQRSLEFTLSETEPFQTVSLPVKTQVKKKIWLIGSEKYMLQNQRNISEKNQRNTFCTIRDIWVRRIREIHATKSEKYGPEKSEKYIHIYGAKLSLSKWCHSLSKHSLPQVKMVTILPPKSQQDQTSTFSFTLGLANLFLQQHSSAQTIS